MKRDVFEPSDRFVDRHVGPSETETAQMLAALNLSSVEQLIEETVPDAIRDQSLPQLPPAKTEAEALALLRSLAASNQVARSFIGMGYYGCFTPPVILRNILENPGWYTQYTPYQAEIAQGRLEALLNFQTMVSDLTGLPLSNSSLLDEATAAAEAMTMCQRISRSKHNAFFVEENVHPQTLSVLRTRAEPLGLEVVVGPASQAATDKDRIFGALLSYPGSDGEVRDDRALIRELHEAGAVVVMATDLLALTLLTPPGELGADIAIGSSQRFGVPMGFGGPHAAFLATHDKHSRHVPGRIIGASKDANGKIAYRLALQTREQHIRRDRATSNICTAQVLLAIIASMYGVYHGAEGLTAIARRTHAWTSTLALGLKELGFAPTQAQFFDTLRIETDKADAVFRAAQADGINLRPYGSAGALSAVGISLDESTTRADVDKLLAVFAEAAGGKAPTVDALMDRAKEAIPESLARTSAFLQHPVFSSHRSEHELLRYLKRLETRDLSLTTSMIPLGSCTMKLNAAAEMLPITLAGFGQLHPYCPPEQARGYERLITDLEGWLSELTGFAATSLQPNAGAQGEYAGLLVIRAYHHARGDHDRTVCLIPVSAHGTNPASAVMAGFQVVAVACDKNGNIDVDDLKAKLAKHQDKVGAIMITYPSTHGVFETRIREICELVHGAGGQVYLDGANMNAQLGVCRPGAYGADVCHLNLHKTFCIPHGGGGPGMGPICVAKHLAEYLPQSPLDAPDARKVGAVSAATYGSPSILPIPYAYIAMMGSEGLRRATGIAILNANYMAKRLEDAYPVLYRGDKGRVAHEFILDLRPFKRSAKVEAEDVAKRLIDFGFHAPTMSFPVPGTLMIEPTESESKAELDRFCDAMLAIREEIRAIENGAIDPENNPLKNAPHTAEILLGAWDRPYSREAAAYPGAWLREHKYWSPVSRVDNAYGDRNLICSCPPLEAYSES